MNGQKENYPAGLIPLLVIAVICSLLITIVNGFTSERIEKNHKAYRLREINEVMPLAHNNDLLSDLIYIQDRNFFNTDTPVGVYRARNNDIPVGLVFMPVVARGYNGAIETVIGINYEGVVTGVRIQDQRETEGLGDRIHQDNSKWIFGFDRRSLQNTPDDGWQVSGEGGEFDQLSGATISSRAVIRAVKNSLDYYEVYRDELYE